MSANNMNSSQPNQSVTNDKEMEHNSSNINYNHNCSISDTSINSNISNNSNNSSITSTNMENTMTTGTASMIGNTMSQGQPNPTATSAVALTATAGSKRSAEFAFNKNHTSNNNIHANAQISSSTRSIPQSTTTLSAPQTAQGQAVAPTPPIYISNNPTAVSFSSSSTIPIAGTGTGAGAGPSVSNKRQNHGQVNSKKQLRREKNAISAKKSRQKRKEATENLLQEINEYEIKNSSLRLQLQIGEEAEKVTREEQDKVTASLHDLLHSGASESEISMNIDAFKERYADYGRDRRSAIDFHLKNVERLLLPTTTTTVVMRAMGGGGTGGVDGSTSGASASASASASNGTSKMPSSASTKHPSEPKALFQLLVNYLKVSDEQAKALKDSRLVARELDTAQTKALEMLQELKHCLTEYGEDLEEGFSQIRNILKPTQAAQFLIWVASNPACMHMLNELWSKGEQEQEQLQQLLQQNSGDQSS